MNVTFKSLAGQAFVLDIDTNEPIQKVKKRICEMAGLIGCDWPVHQLCLLRGQLLDDEQKDDQEIWLPSQTVLESGIKDGDEIWLLIKPNLKQAVR